MAVKSVIDIEINDSDFQRYKASFEKYQEDLKAQPGAWSDVAASAAAAAAAAAEMGVGIGVAAAGLHKANGEADTLTRHAKQQAGFWSSMATNAGKFTSRVVEATRSLLRWGELTGLISGILGAGGLFGIDRLAISAGNQRRNALGLGVTPGEASAFEVNYSRLVDPQTMLSGVNQALHDVTKRVGLYGAGMTEDELKGKDTAQVSSELLTHLKKIADETPEAMMQNVLTARHLDQFINLQDFERLKNTPAAEIGQYQQNFQRDTKDLELTNEQTRAWQDLQVQLHRAAIVIENTFIRGLTALAAPIGRLSAAFTELVQHVLSSKQFGQWVDELAVGIKWLGDYIGSPAFHAGVTWLIEGIDNLGHRFVDFVKQVDEMLPSWADVKKYTAEFGEDLKVAGEALKVFVGVVEDMAKALADAAHTVVDPFTKGTPLNNDSGQFSGQIERWNQDHPDNQIPESGLPDDQGDATGWDRMKNWWNGGNFSGKLMHQSSYRQGGDFSQIEANNNLPSGLLNSVEQTESGARDVRSPAGAEGYFQFMPATAQRFGVDPHDEMSSARGAGAYYRQLLDEFHGDVAKAAAGYNWGEKNVEKDVAQYGDRWREHLPDETRAYVDKVLAGTRQNQMAQQGPKFVPNQGRPSSVAINVNNQTGGNSYISASQLAVG